MVPLDGGERVGWAALVVMAMLAMLARAVESAVSGVLPLESTMTDGQVAPAARDGRSQARLTSVW